VAGVLGVGDIAAAYGGKFRHFSEAALLRPQYSKLFSKQFNPIRP